MVASMQTANKGSLEPCKVYALRQKSDCDWHKYSDTLQISGYSWTGNTSDDREALNSCELARSLSVTVRSHTCLRANIDNWKNSRCIVFVQKRFRDRRVLTIKTLDPMALSLLLLMSFPAAPNQESVRDFLIGDFGQEGIRSFNERDLIKHIHSRVNRLWTRVQ